MARWRRGTHALVKVLVTSTAAIMLALTSLPAAAQRAQAALKSADGKNVGSAELTQTPAGVLIKLSVKGLPAGEHAFHVHGVGQCEPPFTSAGGHFNPGGKKHGMMAAEGHHAGDQFSVRARRHGAYHPRGENSDSWLKKILGENSYR
jgi:Cu-Zn family superoxide dismutase